MKPVQEKIIQQELKPCPFCGGRATLNPMPGTNKNWWRVQCVSHKCGGTTWPLSDQKEAVTLWNRRSNIGQDGL